MAEKHQPKISWDWGTAYDLFASLHVLHHPEKFGLRGSWAAGVRSRLQAAQRAILEDAQALFFYSPIAWVSGLPEPKDATAALRGMEQISPADRLPALAFHGAENAEMLDVLKEVSVRRAWKETDLKQLQQLSQQKDMGSHASKLVLMLDWWSRPEEFGERYLGALQAYVACFFAEEEVRIRPYLRQALMKAQQMGERMDFSRLMVELSQGVKIAILEEADEVMFVPSYWTTPLVVYDSVVENNYVMLFGARPSDVALVPGEVVPDAMLLALKALSDPTRLLILRYLSDKPQTPSQLARLLRLRPPTVIHHLSALRLAGLVFVEMDENDEKRYTVRKMAVEDTFEVLHKFLLVNGKG